MVAGPSYLSPVASNRHLAPAMCKLTNSTFILSKSGGQGVSGTTGITTLYNRK